MMRTRKTVIMLGLAAAMLATAPAAPAQQALLEAIPADAWGFVAVRNLDELNRELLGLAKRLQIPMFGPDGFIESPLALVKAQLGLDEEIDEKNGLAVVLLAGEGFGDVDQRIVVFVPTGSVKGLAETLGAEKGEDGLWKGTVFDEPIVIGEKGGFAVLSPHEDAVKAAVAAEKSVATTLKAGRKKDYAANDLFLWVNTGPVIKLAKPMLEGFMAMAEAMSSGGIEQAQMQASLGLPKKMLAHIDEATGLQIGIDLSPGGLGLNFLLELEPEGELVKLVAGGPNTDQSLLVGLPDDRFLIAFGQRANPDDIEQAVDMVGPMLDTLIEAAADEEGVDAAKLETVKDKILGMLELSGAAFAGSISALPEGPDGLIAGTVVLACQDSAKAQTLLSEMVAAAKDAVTDEGVREALQALRYEKSAETFDGVSVDHLSVALDKVPEVSAEDITNAKKILGQEGVLVRIAAAGPKRLVFMIGGGAKRAAEVVKLCKAGTAPLGENLGIRRVTKTLPQSRNTEMYIAVDQILAVIKSIGTALGEEVDLPFDMKKIDAPVAIVASSGDDHARVDVFVPIELIQSIASIAMQSMMGGGF